MSLRSVIEINNDYLDEILNNPAEFLQFLESIAQRGTPVPEQIRGVRFLAQKMDRTYTLQVR